jgi:hypothetical protein
MGVSASEESTRRVELVYHEDRPFESASIIEKASSLSLSLEKSQEKTAHINVHEGLAPLGCLSSAASPESQQPYLVDWDFSRYANKPSAQNVQAIVIPVIFSEFLRRHIPAFIFSNHLDL